MLVAIDASNQRTAFESLDRCYKMSRTYAAMMGTL
jgi:hypothetical protein